MKRREFIEKSCVLCFGGIVATAFNGCQSVPIYKTITENKTIKVPFGQFIETNYVIARPSGTNYDVAVIKTDEGVYNSFVMICTHADNPLRYNGKEFQCSLHGSFFDRNGTALKGPAEKPLVKLQSMIENNFVIIKLI